ncbi:hypothetical protein FGO68_gene1856 [Halteria grandinella]|uniref:Uncharacterized protein n=1 Tax=Halteria grandinella TaxID=5974 RepID=A0A8J8NS97_HALGN|nr:hypothetical protein FGO68_gene1856 [Halteria grandinella]
MMKSLLIVVLLLSKASAQSLSLMESCVTLWKNIASPCGYCYDGEMVTVASSSLGIWRLCIPSLSSTSTACTTGLLGGAITTQRYLPSTSFCKIGSTTYGNFTYGLGGGSACTWNGNCKTYNCTNSKCSTDGSFVQKALSEYGCAFCVNMNMDWNSTSKTCKARSAGVLYFDGKILQSFDQCAMAQQTVEPTNIQVVTITEKDVRHSLPGTGFAQCTYAGQEFGIYILNNQAKYDIQLEAKFTYGSGKMRAYLFTGQKQGQSYINEYGLSLVDYELPFTLLPQHQYAYLWVMCHQPDSVFAYGYTCGSGDDCPTPLSQIVAVTTAAVCIPIFSIALLLFLYVMMAYKRRMHPLQKRVVWVKRKSTDKCKCWRKRPRTLEEWYRRQMLKVARQDESGNGLSYRNEQVQLGPVHGQGQQQQMPADTYQESPNNTNLRVGNEGLKPDQYVYPNKGQDNYSSLNHYQDNTQPQIPMGDSRSAGMAYTGNSYATGINQNRMAFNPKAENMFF